MLGRSLGRTYPPKQRRRPPSARSPWRVQGPRRGRRCTDVSLVIRAGEIVALAGLVGAGRSELARAIFGAVPATAGRAGRAAPNALPGTAGRLDPGGRRDDPGVAQGRGPAARPAGPREREPGAACRGCRPARIRPAREPRRRGVGDALEQATAVRGLETTPGSRCRAATSRSCSSPGRMLARPPRPDRRRADARRRRRRQARICTSSSSSSWPPRGWGSC